MSNPLDRLFHQLNDAIEEGEFSQRSGFPMMRGGGTNYQIHQDQNSVTIDVELPGVAAKDLIVEVVIPNPSTCVVQWRGDRKQGGRGQPTTISNRLRLGSQVDCDELAANLSYGILRLTAPVKEVLQESSTTRAIPITRNP
jgi:HSP20 family molecular chaperone IbpA